MWPPMWSESRTSIIAMLGFVEELLEVELVGEDVVSRERRWDGVIRGSVAIVRGVLDDMLALCARCLTGEVEG